MNSREAIEHLESYCAGDALAGEPSACQEELRVIEADLGRRRGFQLMARNMAALIPKLPGGTPGIYYFGRAGGDVICEKCGLKYVEHPMGLEEYLHLLCDGNQVKL